MKEITQEITPEVKEILEKGKTEGCLYFLPYIQLDRAMYIEVNKILELLGGKWNRSKKAHVFDTEEDASSILGAVEEGGVIDKKKTYQFFETPEELAKQMVELADIKTGMSVLEPSAGHGAIAKFIPKDSEIYLYEIDKEKCKVLNEMRYTKISCIDFLSTTNTIGGFDRIVMNPPFTKGQDAEHVLHAYDCLNEIGRLVSVMSASVKFNQQKKYAKVRELIETNGEIVEVPQGAFKDSGTNVNTVIVVLNK